jgi:hypothetical protein
VPTKYDIYVLLLSLCPYISFGGLLVPEGIIHTEVSVSGLTSFNRYIEDAGDSTFNQDLRQLTVFLFIAII